MDIRMWPDDDDGGLRIPPQVNTPKEEEGLIFNFENPTETPRPRIQPEYLRPTPPPTRIIREPGLFSKPKLFSEGDDRGRIWGKIGLGLLIMTLYGLLGALVISIGIGIYQWIGVWGLIVPPALVVLGYIGYWVGHKTLD
jgi:hypothetical protein